MDRVEAVRIGTVFAHDPKAYGKWRRAMDRRAGRKKGLTGAALEHAVMRLAQSNPEYVVLE